MLHTYYFILQCAVFLLSSEIRLVEILEGLCDSSSFECNQMVEEHEDHFETWWFKRLECVLRIIT